MRKRVFIGWLLYCSWSVGDPLITSMSGLRFELLSRIYKSPGFICVQGILPDIPHGLIPFKVIVGVGHDRTSIPYARRNLGANLVRLLASGTQPEPKPVGTISKTVRLDGRMVEAGFHLYLKRAPLGNPGENHVILVETFPDENLAGTLMADLVRELRLNSFEDLLFIDRDLDEMASPILTKRHSNPKDNGSPGARSLARALTLPGSRQPDHYPFAVIRHGRGAMEDEIFQSFLDSEGRDARDYLGATTLQLQGWLGRIL